MPAAMTIAPPFPPPPGSPPAGGPAPTPPPLTRWQRLWQPVVNLPHENLKAETGQAALFGIGVAALCALTTGQSFLRYGDATSVAIVGVCAGLFALLFNATYLSPGKRRWFYTGGALFFLVCAGWTLIANALPMVSASGANDERCRAIQEDMLSAHPRKANGPGLFQALGCAPTGDDPTIFVPPTDRESRAGKALPFGGYLTRHS